MFYNLMPEATDLIESIDVECHFMGELGDSSETEYARSLKVITHDTVIPCHGLPMLLRLDIPHINYWINKGLHTLDPERLSITVSHWHSYRGQYHVKRLNCKAGVVIKDHDDMVRYFFDDYKGSRQLHSELNRLNCNR